jgi:hypothetical protein
MEAQSGRNNDLEEPDMTAAKVRDLIKEAVRSVQPRKTAAADILDRMRERQADLTGCVFDADAKIFGAGADEIERLRALVPEAESVDAARDGAEGSEPGANPNPTSPPSSSIQEK